MFEIKVDDEGIVQASGILTIASVDTLRTELVNVLNNDTCKALDFTKVTEIDTAALQVLLTFRKDLMGPNKTVDCSAGPVVREALSLSGLNKIFKAR